VCLVCQEILVLQEDKEILVLLVLMVKMDLMVKLGILEPLGIEENLEKMEVLAFKDCLVNRGRRAILDLLGYRDIKGHLESKVIQEYLVQRVKGVTGDLLDHKEMLVNQDQLDQKALLEKLEIQVHQENRDLWDSQANEDHGAQLANLEVQVLKVCLEWKEDLVPWDLQVPRALLETP